MMNMMHRIHLDRAWPVLRHSIRLIFLSLTILAGQPTMSFAQTRCADVALVLAIDGSGSVEPQEFRLQQLGYAAAFTSPRVLSALAAAGTVDIAVVIWGDPEFSPDILSMRRIKTPDDALSLSLDIASLPRRVTGNTGLGSGLSAAIDILEADGQCAARRIINVSGDGIEKSSPRPRNVIPLPAARKRAKSLGIVINGLAIETELPDLADWYRKKVIVGPGAFVMRVAGFATFGDAIIEKMVREISPKHIADAPADDAQPRLAYTVSTALQAE